MLPSACRLAQLYHEKGKTKKLKHLLYGCVAFAFDDRSFLEDEQPSDSKAAEVDEEETSSEEDEEEGEEEEDGGEEEEDEESEQVDVTGEPEGEEGKEQSTAAKAKRECQLHVLAGTIPFCFLNVKVVAQWLLTCVP